MRVQSEFTEAVSYLGWLPESGVPNDPFHNSKLESFITRIKEGVRAIHLAAGFPHELWPRSVEYFCIAKSVTSLASIHQNETDESKRNKQGWNSYEAANNGDPFEGLWVPGCFDLLQTSPKHLDKLAFEARTVPGLFVGWRLDSGYKRKKIHLVLDYESVRLNAKGCGRPIQVHASFAFPLFHAAKSKVGRRLR